MTARPAFTPVSPGDLLRQSQQELDALFTLLPAPETGSVEGCWRGTLMAIRGLGWLPRRVAAGTYRLLSTPLNPWRGKSFDGPTGANRWFTLPGVAFGNYRVQATHSPVDGLPVVWLDYDLADNLAPLRGIRGEARQLGDNLLLCRMNWQGRSGLHRVLYFTLVRGQ